MLTVSQERSLRADKQSEFRHRHSSKLTYVVENTSPRLFLYVLSGMKLLYLSLAALAANVASVRGTNCSSSLTVDTSTGSYTGLIDKKYPNTRQFRAIPFAEPPVASRRFLPPQKLSPSSDHHYSTRFPPSCPQFVTAVQSIYSGPLTAGNLIYNGNQNDSSGLVGEATSEDCLYLAIWTPTIVPAAGLPVLFFMTGGGNIIGGVDIPWQFPTSWIERSQSHIVVTINYRLNILGFPNARGLPYSQQNLGVYDQRVALEWVRDNIAAFGGDPERITMWGQSAGAADADILSYAYPDDPIAQAYYLQSGVALTGTIWPRDTTFSNFSFVARAMGCDVPCGDDSGKAELECMRQVPVAQLENFIGQYGDAGTTPALYFMPNRIPDNVTIFQNYTARAAAGEVARGPVLMSVTSNEGSSLVPWPVDNLTAGPYQPIVTALDLAFVCSVYKATIYRNQIDVPVFRLQYAATFPNLNYYDWLGAYHAADLPIIFGTYHLLDGVANTTAFEVAVSHALQDRVLAFIQDPYNGPQKLGWEPMIANATNGGFLLRMGADGKVLQDINGVDVDGPCYGVGEYDPFP